MEDFWPSTLATSCDFTLRSRPLMGRLLVSLLPCPSTAILARPSLAIAGAYHANEDRVGCWTALNDEHGAEGPGTTACQNQPVLMVLCDGHDGHECASFVQQHFKSIFKAKLEAARAASSPLPLHDSTALAAALASDATPLAPADKEGRACNAVARALQESFEAVEASWTARMQAALEAASGSAVARLARGLSSGRGTTSSRPLAGLTRIKGGTSGACLTAAAIVGTRVYVANVGDCRAVLRRADGSVLVLTNDHRCSNSREKARILELGGYIRNERVDGVLEPSRTIGDLREKAALPFGVLHALPDLFSASLDDPSAPLDGLLGGPPFWTQIRPKDEEAHLARALAAAKTLSGDGSGVPVASSIRGFATVVPTPADVALCVDELNSELLSLARARGLPEALHLQPPGAAAAPARAGTSSSSSSGGSSRSSSASRSSKQRPGSGASALGAPARLKPTLPPQLLTFTTTRALATAPRGVVPPAVAQGPPPPPHPLLRPVTLAEARASASYLPISFVLVASDGVWDVLSTEAAAAIVAHALAIYCDPTAAAAELVRKACEHGSVDDVSVAVAWLHRVGPHGEAVTGGSGGDGTTCATTTSSTMSTVTVSAASSPVSSAVSSRAGSGSSAATRTSVSKAAAAPAASLRSA